MDSLLKFVSFFSPNSRKYLIYHLISNKTLGINFSPLSIYSKNCKTIQETRDVEVFAIHWRKMLKGKTP